MPKWVLTTTLLALASYVGCSVAQTISPESKVMRYPQHIRTKPGAYIIEFEETIRSSNIKTFVAGIEALPDVTISNQFTKLFNGFAVTTAPKADPVRLAKVKGVKRVWPVRFHDLNVVRDVEGGASHFLHQMTGVEKVLKELNLDGTGVKVGIVDSGVDYTHPELGNCWKTPGCIWQYGQDFIGDKYDFTSNSPIIDPNPTPMDCAGHGTHVSGILAAQGPVVQGVAPGATYGMYRVFSCPIDDNVSSSDDILLQGIEAAYNDGHDIISLSLGGGAWPQDPLAVACSKLVEQGVVVVAANGNDGSNGLFTSGSPAVGHNVISVGSVDNWNITGQIGTIASPSETHTIYLGAANAEKHPFVITKPLPISHSVYSSDNALGCKKYPPNIKLKGKVALVRRGECTFSVKAQHAQEAGADAVAIYNNVHGILLPAINESISIPVAMLTKVDGELIVRMLSSSNGNVTMVAPRDSFGTFPSDTGGMMSTFSSYGPSPDLNIDPIISAPGGNIWSTFPLKLGKYASLSGTSMATPYVSGAVALLLQAQPDLEPNDVAGMLAASAKPILDLQTNKMVHPYWSGAGLLNIYDSIVTRVRLEPLSLSLNNSNFGIIRDIGLESLGPVRWLARNVTIRNTDFSHGVSVIIKNSAANSLSTYTDHVDVTYYPKRWPPDLNTVTPFNTLPQVYSTQPTVYVPAGETRNVTVFIISPSGLKESEFWFYGGFLNFTMKWESEEQSTYHVVPYSGYNGNYHRLSVLAPMASTGLPALADNSLNFIKDPSNLVISGTNNALVLFSLVVPCRIFSATLINSSRETVGYLTYGYQDYVSRNLPNSNTPISAVSVRNVVYKDKEQTIEVIVPSGKYHVQLKALSPLGDPNKLQDYEVWDSPTFIII
ncbi:hypothetical protein GGI07_000750 [Coemansia sp. Benny D115]|nr:hypothetical protein GGI07_000750 [Coemansia sp. Benny D115]